MQGKNITIVRGASTLHLIPRRGFWTRLADGLLCRHFYAIAASSLGLYLLSFLLGRLGCMSQSGAVLTRRIALAIAALWVAVYLANELVGAIRFRTLEREHASRRNNEKIWLGESLGAPDVLEKMRSAPFPIIVTSYPLWMRLSGTAILGVAVSLALLVVIVLLLLDFARVGFVSGAMGLLIGVGIVEPFVFPNRLKIGPGRLQTVRANVVSGTVSIEHDIRLSDAAVTIRSIQPTRVTVRWDDASHGGRLRIYHIPKELCFYVWLASVSVLPVAEFPDPTLGEAISGVRHKRGP